MSVFEGGTVARVDISGLLTPSRDTSYPATIPGRQHGVDSDFQRSKTTPLLSLVTGKTVSELTTSAFARAPIPDGIGCQWQALSLFAGGGGLDLGFLQEGVRPATAYDISEHAVASYNTNLPAVARVADLSRFSPDGEATVLLAGAPCQGFSTVGKRSIEDPRNALLMRVAEVALAIRPRVVVIENVPAALSGELGQHWRALEDCLRFNGYNVRRLNLHGEESGIAQRRRRLFLIAWIGSDAVRVELETIPPPSLRECLAGVASAADQHPIWPTSAGLDALIAKHILPGQKLCNVRTSERAVPTWEVPEVFGITSQAEREVLCAVSRLRRRARRRAFGDGDPVALSSLAIELGRDALTDVDRLIDARYLRWIDNFVELRHTYNGKYRRLDWDDLSPTVDTHFGRAALFLHPDEDRGLTQREAARIQGFPDSYRLLKPQRERFELIGNAVPPPMAGRVARFVREALLKA